METSLCLLRRFVVIPNRLFYYSWRLFYVLSCKLRCVQAKRTKALFCEWRQLNSISCYVNQRSSDLLFLCQVTVTKSECFKLNQFKSICCIMNGDVLWLDISTLFCLNLIIVSHTGHNEAIQNISKLVRLKQSSSDGDTSLFIVLPRFISMFIKLSCSKRDISYQPHSAYGGFFRVMVLFRQNTL